MRISVVVPTRNRAASLRVMLHSMMEQRLDAKHWDLLVVDNGSTDATGETAADAIASRPDLNIRYVYESVPGLLAGRHRGTAETRGEIIVFVDDDIEADPDWLNAVMEAFSDASVQVVGGRSLPRFEVPPPRWLGAFWEPTPYGGRMCTWLSLLDLGDEAIEIDPAYVFGLNFAIRRQALLNAGGFHPDCLPRELQHLQGDGETGLADRIRAAGWRAVYHPRALVYHRTPPARLTTEYFEARAFYQGVCNSYTSIRERGSVGVFDSWRRRASRLRQLTRMLVENSDSRDIRQRTLAAYEAGFRFHQRAVQSDPVVLNWVLRPDYWNYELPGTAGR